MNTFKKILASATLLAIASTSNAELIGQWKFDDTSDSTGNFADLTLNSGATLDGGRLNLTNLAEFSIYSAKRLGGDG